MTSSSPRLAAADTQVPASVLALARTAVQRHFHEGDPWTGHNVDPLRCQICNDAADVASRVAFAAGRESVWADAETDYRVYHVHHEGGGKCFVDRYTDPGDAREAADFFAKSDPRKSSHWVERTETVEREVPLNA